MEIMGENLQLTQPLSWIKYISLISSSEVGWFKEDVILREQGRREVGVGDCRYIIGLKGFASFCSNQSSNTSMMWLDRQPEGY